MTQYNWQLLCAKWCGKLYTIIFFKKNGFLLDCNHSLANSLLYHEQKYLGWIGLWWWWFGVVWVILISLMRMDWCGFSLVFNPFAGLATVQGKASKDEDDLGIMMDSDRIRMKSDPNFIFYHILIRIRMRMRTSSDTNTKRIVRIWIRIRIPSRLET